MQFFLIATLAFGIISESVCSAGRLEARYTEECDGDCEEKHLQRNRKVGLKKVLICFALTGLGLIPYFMKPSQRSDLAHDVFTEASELPEERSFSVGTSVSSLEGKLRGDSVAPEQTEEAHYVTTWLRKENLRGKSKSYGNEMGLQTKTVIHKAIVIPGKGTRFFMFWKLTIRILFFTETHFGQGVVFDHPQSGAFVVPQVMNSSVGSDLMDLGELLSDSEDDALFEPDPPLWEAHRSTRPDQFAVTYVERSGQRTEPEVNRFPFSRLMLSKRGSGVILAGCLALAGAGSYMNGGLYQDTLGAFVPGASNFAESCGRCFRATRSSQLKRLGRKSSRSSRREFLSRSSLRKEVFESQMRWLERIDWVDSPFVGRLTGSVHYLNSHVRQGIENVLRSGTEDPVTYVELVDGVAERESNSDVRSAVLGLFLHLVECGKWEEAYRMTEQVSYETNEYLSFSGNQPEGVHLGIGKDVLKKYIEDKQTADRNDSERNFPHVVRM